MLDPAELFNPEPHLESDEYPQPDGERPTLLITLGGYGDAGEAQEREYTAKRLPKRGVTLHLAFPF